MYKAHSSYSYLRILLLLAVTAAVLALAACGGAKNDPAQAKGQLRDAPIPVSVANAVQQDVPVSVKAIGNVEAFSTVSVKSMVAGQITKVGFKEGQDVRKGSLLFVIDPRPFQAALQQALGNLAKDKATAANAKAQATRWEALYKEGVVSREQHDQVVTQAQSLSEAVAADEAAVQNARVNLTYCTITSPIDGRTGNLQVHEGNLVKANDVPLVTINQVQPINVTFSVPQQVLPDVKKFHGQHKLAVRAKVPNEPESDGTLSFIDNAVDPQTGTIKLKGTFANKDLRLWPGQFADVSLTLAIDRNALVVPSSAVQNGQTGQFVFVVKAGKAEKRDVTISRIYQDKTVILSGVNPGDQVVTDGQLRLTPGAKVALSTAPGSPTSQSAAQDQPARQGNGL